MIPLIDLKAQYQSLKKDIDHALVDTLESGQFLHGKQVQKFEKDAAKYVGTHYCIGLNSGTDALTIGLAALQLQTGDEIIIPANSNAASFNAIIHNNLKPVIVDVRPHDFGIDLAQLHRHITPRTKAVIVGHLFGQADQLDEIKDVLSESEHNINLIEDISYAFGADYKEHKVGSFGIFAACSFHPTKSLGAYGDGAAIFTNDPKIEKMVRLLQDNGQDHKQLHSIVGSSSHLDEMQAAVLSIKLVHLSQWIATRKEIAEYYSSLFAKDLPYVTTPSAYEDRTCSYNSYVIRVPQRDRLHESLKRRGIQTSCYYATPLHLQRSSMFLEHIEGDFPVAEACAKEMLLLPIYPQLTAESCRQIVAEIREFYSKI